jgi:hypothetical protein
MMSTGGPGDMRQCGLGRAGGNGMLPFRRTENIGVDEEVVARLCRVKMEEKVGCKEQIAVHMRLVNIMKGIQIKSVLLTCTPADNKIGNRFMRKHEMRESKQIQPCLNGRYHIFIG